MTVSYTDDVATSKFGTFFKLLFRWRGSIYKLLLADYVVFLIGYFTVSIIYRFALTEHEKRQFEQLSQFCDRWIEIIPLSFLLGFYVSIVYQRWWEMFLAIPWPTSLALTTTAHLYGHDDRSRLMRRSILRYSCLAIAMVFSYISPPVRRRFPTLNHFKEAGLLNDNELSILDGIKTQYPKYFIPLVWATSIIRRGRKENKISDDVAKKIMVEKINDIRQGCMMLLNYDWIPIPLEYTQVVTLSVYSYFLAALFGRQFLDPTRNIKGHEIDIFFPVFTSLQFIFYVGWLKVAECLINPFGEDDDDFELNAIIDMNLQLAYLIVDEMHAEHPEMTKDAFWELPSHEVTLPYAPGCEQPPKPYQGSAAAIDVSTKEAKIIRPSSFEVNTNNSSATSSRRGVEPGNFMSRLFSRPESKQSRNKRISADLADVVLAHQELVDTGVPSGFSLQADNAHLPLNPQMKSDEMEPYSRS